MFTINNPAEKMSETDTHVFFLNGPFSQWHKSAFVAPMMGEERQFNCAEQYMMAAKAALFGDSEIFERIMAVQQETDWRAAPKRHKELGRMVRGFDPLEWNAVAQEVVYDGNYAKFSQNYNLLARLMETDDKILVEGAHYDPIWGVGLAWNDPKIIDPANWRGTNWLGKALMRVRLRMKDA